ncbi:MAG: hypothetical protein QOJ92_1947 [Frankiales bacterium]|nr:hypothetical protein [Frankiales bacterium]
MDVTCSSARVTQTGLPPASDFEVVLLDPGTTARELASAQVRSDTQGRIDVRLGFTLGGADRLHAEVEQLGSGTEYGETGVDIGARCGPAMAAHRRTFPLVLGLVALVVAAGCALGFARSRGRHR